MESRNNADYATWLNESVQPEVANIHTLYIKKVNDQEDTITDNEIIDLILTNASETWVSNVKTISFAGSGLQWTASDQRVVDNLERTTEDNSYVPVGVKRPVGA